MSPNIAESGTITEHRMTTTTAAADAKVRPLTSAHKLRVAASILAPAILFASHSAVADENGISLLKTDYTLVRVLSHEMLAPELERETRVGILATSKALNFVWCARPSSGGSNLI